MKQLCKLCGSHMINGSRKVKGGEICNSCFDQLPISIQNSVSEFTVPQIQQYKKLAIPYNGKKFIWKFCHNLKVGIDFLVLNGMEYKLRDLRSVSLNFHPKGITNQPSTVMGLITLVLETKTPHVMIEEVFVPTQIKAEYVITGMDIVYHFGNEIEQLIYDVRAALGNKDGVIRAAKEDFESIRRETREKGARKEAQAGGAGDRKKPAAEMTPLERKLARFGLKMPFTEDELRKKRNALLKEEEVHPDQSGTQATRSLFNEIQEDYMFLKKFATKA